MYIIYVCIDIYVEILFSILRYRSLFMVRFKKAKGAIRTAVKKMIDFFLSLAWPIHFSRAQNVLQN